MAEALGNTSNVAALAVVGVVLVVGVLLGILAGRYALPRRPARPDTSATPVIAHLVTATAPTATAPTTAAPTAAAPSPAPSPVPRPALTVAAQQRAAYVEARLAQSQAQARVASLEAKLSETQSMFEEAVRQVRQADTQLVRMRLQVRELEDRKEAEMGRLESGAIAALESTTATHREQIASLEEKLRAAQAAADEYVQELAVERSLSAQLRSALDAQYKNSAR